jgi:hypothetical protein
MGQIIDLDQRRLAAQPRKPALASPVRDWSVAHTAYVDGVVMPMVELWRASLATWARFWLAPMGLEIRPAELRRPRRTPDRADVSR